MRGHQTISGNSLYADSELAKLYQEYKDQIFGFAYKNLKSTDRSHDIVQEVFEVLCQKDMSKVRNIRSFIFQITHHKVVDQLRYQAKNHKLRQEMWNIIEASQSNTDHALIEEEYLKCLERAKNRLTSQQLLIFELSRQEGLSHRKIAERLDISTNTVKNHMVSAMKTLREYLRVNSDVVFSILALLPLW